MTLFWIALAVLVGVSMVALAAPLFVKSAGRGTDGPSAEALNLSVYRSEIAEAETAAARDGLSASERDARIQELKQRLLQDVGGAAVPPAPTGPFNPNAALAMIVAAPILAAFTYALIGQPGAINPPPPPPVAQHQMTRQDVVQMVEKLSARLRESPGDTEAWVTLARSQTALGNYDQALTAYEVAANYAPNNASILADFADLLALRQGKRFDGEPDKLIARALEADPKHVKARALAGSSAFSKRDLPAAIDHWKTAVAALPPDSPAAKSLLNSIRQAESGGAAVPAPGPGPGKAIAGPVIQGMIEIDAKLMAQVKPDDVLFIFARRAGSRMPVAVARMRAGALPAAFSLDDSQSLDPNLRLSSAGTVQIEAKISKSGSATPAAGDMFGVSGPVTPGARGVTVRISEVRP